MAKLTNYQFETLKAIDNGRVMLRGAYDRFWWQDDDNLCSAVAHRLRSKGLIKTVYLNSVRDVVKITDAGRSLLNQEAV